MNNTLTNKVAYITGGSKGIGFGIAQALVQQGMKVAISGRDLKAVQAAAAQLESKQVLAVQSDVRSAASENNAIKQTVDHFGSLDLVVANAGIGVFFAD